MPFIAWGEAADFYWSDLAVLATEQTGIRSGAQLLTWGAIFWAAN